jgi:hypothetical protein
VILYVIPIALCIAFVLGVVLRAWSVTLPSVTFAKVSPPYAAGIVTSFLEGVSETRFGFPSGVFRVNESKSDANSRVTVQEIRPGYSVTDGCAVASASAGFAFLSEADGCFEACLGILAMVFIAGPIWALNLTEKGFRWLLESEVQADLEAVSDPDGTLVTIRLRGVSAILLRSAYEAALTSPVLPDDIAIAAGVKPPPAQTAQGRPEQ